MKIALIQMNSGSDKGANIAAARTLIEQAVREEKPDWICLPEVFDFMGGSRVQKFAAAEELPGGPAGRLVAPIAAKLMEKSFVERQVTTKRILEADAVGPQ